MSDESPSAGANHGDAGQVFHGHMSTNMNATSPQQLIAAIAPQLLTQHLLDVIAQDSKALPTPAEQHRLGRVQADLAELRYFAWA